MKLAQETRNPDFDKPTLEDLTEEVKANELKTWDIIALPDLSMSMSMMEKYVYRVEDIDRAENHIVLIMNTIWWIRTINIKEKIKSLLFGLLKEETGDDKRIVVYEKYEIEDDGLIKLAYKNNDMIKKVRDLNKLEEYTDTDNLY